MPTVYDRALQMALNWGSANSLYSIIIFSILVGPLGWFLWLQWERRNGMTFTKALGSASPYVAAIAAVALVWIGAYVVAFLKIVNADEKSLESATSLASVEQQGLRLYAMRLHEDINSRSPRIQGPFAKVSQSSVPDMVVQMINRLNGYSFINIDEESFLVSAASEKSEFYRMLLGPYIGGMQHKSGYCLWLCAYTELKSIASR